MKNTHKDILDKIVDNITDIYKITYEINYESNYFQIDCRDRFNNNFRCKFELCLLDEDDVEELVINKMYDIIFEFYHDKWLKYKMKFNIHISKNNDPGQQSLFARGCILIDNYSALLVPESEIINEFVEKDVTYNVTFINAVFGLPTNANYIYEGSMSNGYILFTETVLISSTI